MKLLKNRPDRRTGSIAVEPLGVIAMIAILAASLLPGLNARHQPGVASSTSAGDNQNVLMKADEMRCLHSCSPDSRELYFYRTAAKACSKLGQPPT
jgi:hypothetical protein